MVVYFQVTDTDNFQVLGKEKTQNIILTVYLKINRLISLTWKGFFALLRFDYTNEIHVLHVIYFFSADKYFLACTEMVKIGSRPPQVGIPD